MSVTPSESAPTRHDFHRRCEEVKPSKWDINNLVMNYLLTEGYPEAAKKFAQEANISEPKGETENIEERLAIRQAILAGDIQTAIAHINDLTPDLLDCNKRLHFSLLRLELTELIKRCTASSDGDISPALDFAQTKLAPLAPTDPSFLSDLERTMALLIFPKDNLAAPLVGLLDPEQRLIVAEAVNKAILEELEFAGEPNLKGLVKFRAWAERRANEKKLSLPEEGIDLFDRNTGTEASGDCEDSVMKA